MNSNKQRILIVDDEGALARLMKILIENLGYGVDWAGNGKKALALGAQQDYAAIICDLLMPTMGGIELFEIWKDTSPQLAERMIFVTGDNLGQRTNRFLNQCGRPCLYKPFDIHDLTDTLERVTKSDSPSPALSNA